VDAEIMTAFQFAEAERHLAESLADYRTSTGTGRATARAILRHDIARYRIARRAFFRSNKA
jgi:hypothetical protein